MPHRKSYISASKLPLYYVLKDGKPVQESDPHVLGAFIEDFDARNVGYTLLYAPDGTEICVSTNFMCVNDRFGGGDPPLLWETMIFWPGNTNLHGWHQHYATVKAARAGHKAAIALVKATLLEEEKK